MALPQRKFWPMEDYIQAMERQKELIDFLNASPKERIFVETDRVLRSLYTLQMAAYNVFIDLVRLESANENGAIPGTVCQEVYRILDIPWKAKSRK